MGSGSLPRLEASAALFKNELHVMLQKLRPALSSKPSEGGFSDRYEELSQVLSPAKLQMDEDRF